MTVQYYHNTLLNEQKPVPDSKKNVYLPCHIHCLEEILQFSANPRKYLT